MKQSTFSAQVANNLLTVLQGYSKTIRLLLVMFLTLTVSANAWGAEITYTHAFTTKPSIGNNTLSNITWSVEASNLNNYNSGYAGVQFGTSKVNGSITLTSVNAWGEQSNTSYTGYTNVKYVYVWLNAGSGTPTATVTIGGKAASKSGTVSKNTAANSDYEQTSKLTFTPTSGGNTGVIVITASTSSKAGYIAAIEVVCETPAASCTSITPSLSYTPSSLSVGGTANPTLTGNSGNGSVTYSSSNTSVATVNASTGIVTAKAAGATTITATIAANNGYCEGTATANVTVTADPYTVTLNAGPGTCAASVTEASAGAGVTLPTPTLDCGDWEFAGWWTGSVAETTTSPGELLTAGSNYKPASDCTLYAVYSHTEAGGGGSTDYVLTNIGDIDDDDIVVITMTTSGGTTYAMSNNNGTSAPTATIVTVSGSTLTSDIADNLKWNITNNDGSLTIYPNGTTSTWLYCTNTNNGVKVGTGTANEFTINDGYLYTSQTTEARYVGVYTTNPDWRCYTSATGNIANQTLGFYVKSSGGSTTTYNSNPDCGGDDPEPTGYTITFEANGGTRIDKITDATALPDPLPTTTRAHYTFAGWFTDEDCTQAATAGATINADITLYAKWTPITYTVTFNAGSGTCATEPTQGNFETGLELPTATPCPYASTNGWSFVGWSESSVSETTVRPAIHTGNYKPTKNITLHAVYTKTGIAQGGAGEFILSLEYETTTYYVGQTFDNNKLSAETEQTNAARFTIEDNYLHYEGGYISHVATQSSTDITRQTDKANAQAWTIAANGNTITFTSTADNTRGLGFNYNNGSPRFAAYKLNEKDGETIKYPSTFTKTSVSGGNVQVTTYNSYPSCEAPIPPTWQPATITHTAIKANCGSTTVLGATGENGPATISFSGTYLQNSVTVTASDGFLVSINKTNDAAYSDRVTVNPVASGENQGKITQNVYVIAQAPAQSGNYDGTITLTGADITNGSQVINVTAAVTCTQYTITWSVSGDTEMIEPTTFYAGGEWDLPENPDDFDCNGREFVGWTTSEIIGETPNAPAELYKSKGNFPEINEDKVFYAVFATSSGNDSDNATVSVSIENYAETNSWTDAKRYNTINISSHITATATGETNTGKYYENGKNWRLYQTESPTLTFNAQDGYNILSITIVYTVSNTGILTFNGSDITSDTPCEINASSAEFGVGNTSDATNGQVRITSISVTYSGGGGGYSGYATNCNPCDNSNFTISESNFTISKDSTLNLGALIQTENQSTIIYTCNTPNGTITDNGLFSATESGTYTVIIHQDSDNQDHCAVNKTITIKVVGEIVTLKWSVNGATNTNLSPGTVEKNTPIGTLPVPKTGCDDKTFMGWTTTSTVNNDGSDIEYIKPTTAPTENTTYYAVFASEGNQNSGDLEAIFYESFNKINGQGGNDEQWNATDNQKVGAGTDAIDSLITNHSWNITKGYEAYQCVKMGASSAQGIITTPAINQLNGDAVLTFRAGAWDNGGEELDIIVEVSGGATISPSAFTLKKAQFDTYTANITGGSSETKITIKAKEATKNRFFIDDIRIAAGTISFEDYTTRCGTYTVTYHGFGGYSTICGDNPAEKVVEVGSTFTVATCTPEDPKGLGRIFAGEWYTNPNGRGDTYKPGDSFVVEEDVVLYAKWTLNTNTAPLPVDDENKDLATTDIVVTGGTTLTLQAGTTTINSLTLKGGLQDNGSYAMPVVNIPTGATLVRNNNKINLDLKVNNKSYYPFAVPFEVANTSANVNYINTTLKEYANANNGYGKYYRILEYNGAGRADNGVHEDNWVHVGRTDVKLMPGKGYAISAVPASGQDTVTIRITMTVDNAWLADGEQESITVKEQTTTRNKVTVTAHTGPATDINNGGHQRHAGWNFVANPYLSKFAGNNVVNDVEYIKGSINIQNKYTYEDTEVTYVTIPAYNFAYYDQVELSEAALSPAYSFFVQVGTGGTMTFETAGRQQAPASIAARNAEERPVKMDVDITLSDNHSSDQTGIIISDRYSDAYEIGRDLEKLFGSAYNLSVYTLMADNTPLAFQALAIRSNMQVIPVGYRTPAQGEYTFRLNEATSSIDLLNEQYEQLVLVDYQTGELTNLLIADYTFYSERTQADNRFAIYAVPRQNAPTDLPNAIGQDKQAQKILHNGHLYILRDGNVYNGNGQIVK